MIKKVKGFTGELKLQEVTQLPSHTQNFGTLVAYNGEENSGASDIALLIHSNTDNGSAIFVDSSISNHGIIKGGSPYHSTTQQELGSTSIYFNGTDSYLSIAEQTNEFDQSGDYTWETFINIAADCGSSVIFARRSEVAGDSQSELYFNPTTNKLSIWYIPASGPNDDDAWTSGIETTSTLSRDTWYHIAFVRHGSNNYVFINGTLDNTLVDSTEYAASSAPFCIGSENSVSTALFKGYLDEIRISNAAQYTTNFTVTTVPFEAISYRDLLYIKEDGTLLNISSAAADIESHIDDTASHTSLTITDDTTTVNDLQTLRVNPASGFSVDDDTSGQATLNLGSTFNPITISGQDQLDATGEEELEIEAGTGITLTTDINSTPQKLTISSNINVGQYIGVWDADTNAPDISSTTPNSGDWYKVSVSGSTDIDGETDWNIGDLLLYNGTSWDKIDNTEKVHALDDTSLHTGVVGAIEDNLVAFDSNGLVKDSGKAISDIPDPFDGEIDTLALIGQESAPVYEQTKGKIYTIGSGGLYDQYTSLLLHSDTTNGDTSIIDSANGHTISKIGSPTHSTTQQKFGTSSIYFDDSSMGLQIANHADLQLSNVNFTIDFWIYPTDVSHNYIMSMEGVSSRWYFMFLNNCKFTDDSAGFTIQGGSPVINQWQHIAIIRNGNSFNIYIDGTSIASGSTSASLVSVGDLNICGPGPSWGGGYMDEIRISKGIARWTTNFTPPTSPYEVSNITVNDIRFLDGQDNDVSLLPSSEFDGQLDDVLTLPEQSLIVTPNLGFGRLGARTTTILDGIGGIDTNTKLMIHSNTIDGSTGFIDVSSNARTITVAGNTIHSTDQKKFGATSVYSDVNDGSSYISVPYSDDFNFTASDCTIDFWAYRINATWATFVTSVNSTQDWMIYTYDNGNLAIGRSGVNEITCGAGTLGVGQWYHIAVTREQATSTTRIYVNGVLEGSGTTAVWTNSVNPVRICAMYGYMDEVRISNIRRWTTEFTPPTQAYDSGTIIGLSYVNYQGTYYDLLSTTANILDDGNNSITPTEIQTHIDDTSIHPDLSNSLILDDQTATPTEVDDKITLYSRESGIVPSTVHALIHSDSTDGNTTFVDSSEHGYTLSTSGTIDHSTDQSKFGATSIDTRSGHLEMTYNAAWELGTNNFTIDFWLYPTSFPGTYYYIFGNGRFLIYAYSDGRFGCGVGGQWEIVSSAGGLTTGSWQHFAITRNGNLFSVYKNGTLLSSGTQSSNLANGSSNVGIGSDNGNTSDRFQGYIDEFRYIKSVEWTTTFTPETEPYYPNTPQRLEYIKSDGSIVILDKLLVTDGTTPVSNVSNITLNGATATDDTGGAITIDINENNLDIDSLAEKIAPVDEDILVLEDTEDSNNLKKVQLSNVRSVFNGEIDSLALIGQQNAPTYTQTQGILYSTGTGGYPASTQFLLHSNTTHGDTTFEDSIGNVIFTPQGTISHNTTYSKFGTSSIYFDGTNSLEYPAGSVDMTGDFTIETWAYFTQSPAGTYCKRFLAQGNLETINGDWSWGIGDVWGGGIKLNFAYRDEGSVTDLTSTSGLTLPLDTWHHFAAVRDGSTLYFFYNGVEVDSFSISLSTASSSTMYIGRRNNGSGPFEYMVGYMDEVRASDDALWATDFTLETEAYGSEPIIVNDIRFIDGQDNDISLTAQEFNGTLSDALTLPEQVSVTTPTEGYGRVASKTQAIAGSILGNDTNTKLLIHSNTSDQSTMFVDSSSSGKTITKYGSVIHSTTQQKFGTTSLYFDGSDSYLELADHDDWDISNTDGTIDFWVYFNALDSVLCGSTLSNADGDWFIYCYSDGRLKVGKNGNSEVGGNAGTVTTGQWYHVAVTYEQSTSTTHMYVDGTSVGSTTSGVWVNSTNTFRIGHGGSTVFGDLNGYIDEFRFTKGERRWSGNFTPPTKEYDNGTEVGLVFVNDDGVEYNLLDSGSSTIESRLTWRLSGGPLQTTSNMDGAKLANRTGTIQSIYITCDDTGTTGSDLIIDVLKNGTSIYTGGGTKPTIAANTGTFQYNISTDMDDAIVTATDVYVVEIESVPDDAEGLTCEMIIQ